MGEEIEEDSESDEERKLEECLKRLKLEQRRERPTKLQKLEHDMKLLQWHKLANEAALKAAIIRNKRMKKEDLEKRKSFSGKKKENVKNANKQAWLHDMIAREKAKGVPQKVEPDVNSKSSSKKKMNSQSKMLKYVKKKLYEKELIRQRNQRYRDGRRVAETIKKEQNPFKKRENKNRSVTETILQLEDTGISTSDYDESFMTHQQTYLSPHSDLSQRNERTLEAINKIVDLEQRIKELQNQKQSLEQKHLPLLKPSYSNLFESSHSSGELPSKYLELKKIYKDDITNDEHSKLLHIDRKFQENEDMIKRKLNRGKT